MAKQVRLSIRIDQAGRVHAKPEGTEGDECLDLMEFLKRIPGMRVVESGRTDGGAQTSQTVTNHQNLEH